MDADATMTDASRSAFHELPFEILTQIALELLPSREPCIWPPANIRNVSQQPKDEGGFKYSLKDFLAFAYLNKNTYAAMLPLLYYAPTIRDANGADNLAESLPPIEKQSGSNGATESKDNADVAQDDKRVQSARHLFMVGQNWETKGRDVIHSFDHLKSMTIGVTKGVDGPTYALPHGGRCRPRRVTIANTDWNTDCSFYHGPSHAMLLKTTHLHTLCVTPYDIDHLTGVTVQPPYDPVQAEWYTNYRRLPKRPYYIPLSHLRLSRLLPGMLAQPNGPGRYDIMSYRQRMSFSDFILHRVHATAYKKLEKTNLMNKEIYEHHFVGHQALYKLAVASARFPKFRRLLIEVTEPLPRNPEPEVHKDGSGLADDMFADRRTARIDIYWREVQETKKWIQAIVDECRSPRSRKDDLGELRLRDRILKEKARDNCYRQRYTGPCEYLEKYFAEKKAEAERTVDYEDLPEEWPRVEVRIVAPRPEGWSDAELLQDFQAQVKACDRRALQVRTGAAFKRAKAKAEKERENKAGQTPGEDNDNDQNSEGRKTKKRKVSTASASDYDSEANETDYDSERDADDDVYDDGTCFSDPDVFELARSRPWLAYEPITGTDSPKDRDARRKLGDEHGEPLPEEESDPLPESAFAKKVREHPPDPSDWRDRTKFFYTGLFPRLRWEGEELVVGGSGEEDTDAAL